MVSFVQQNAQVIAFAVRGFEDIVVRMVFEVVVSDQAEYQATD